MNRVTKRTWLMAVFILVLLGGMVFFIWEYTANASQWVGIGGLKQGMVTDRSGNLVMDVGNEREYSRDALTRKSMLHWVGDRNGYISTGVISHYAGAMSGFDLINGIYDTSGDGSQATLTLSSKVQNTALEALNGRKGTVAVYNYKTGEILCAVTSPNFDPDNVPDIAADTTGQYEGVYLNRFLQSTYIPGSIFKIVTTAVALECVPDILDKTFSCEGILEYGEGENIATVTCERAHGKQNLKAALAHSCNCAFAQISELVGKKNMEKYVDRFQVTQPLKFDGVTTAKGNYDISNTGSVSFAWSCIGQHTDQINPARYMTFMGAIAGGGVGTQPYIMSRVTVGEETTYQAKSQKTDRIMSADVAATLKEYMRNNVSSIYGDENFHGMNVCAKSGTSQLGGEQTSNAMFAGFVEDEAYPLAFVVVVENGGYGASACVPVLSRVLSACKIVLDAE